MLGVVGGALLVLADRAQDAQAQTLDPPAAPTIPAVPPLDLPPVTAPPTAPPPVPEPALPPTPNVPPALPLPAPTLPTAPAVAAPEVPAPVPPVVPPAPDVPGAPAAPGIPGLDPHHVTGTVGPLPDVPEVSPPDATLPELPDPVVPLDGLLDLSAAPPPAAPAPVNAPDLAPSVTVPDAARSRIALVETAGRLAGIDIGLPPARAPPPDAPGSPHPCPGGGSTHPTRADPAGLLPPGTDDASRRAGLLAEARAYASALLRDPLLRPD
jgi:hypothetical protein